MFRFLFKWSLQITGTGILGYHHLLNTSQQADVKGMFNSFVNSTRASYIVSRSIYDYMTQLKPFSYNGQEYHKKRSEIHTRVANRILQLSKTNKGIYLKLGQYLGNLDRVMPMQYTQVLQVLQDSGPSIPYEQIKVVMEQDIDIELKYIFSKFNKEAIAAASLAQVHKATLKNQNKEVAVKIQFPFLRSQSKWDLWVLEKITTFCNYLMVKNDFKDVDLLYLYKTWTNTLVEELDFMRQIANAQRTRALFRGNRSIHIPKIYSEYSSQRVIVMQYIDGVKINEPQKIKSLGFDTKQVGRTLVNIFSDMIFKHGFVHCDAHPGNILVRPHPKRQEFFQIVLLDHGLYRRLEPEFIHNFSKFWLSLIKFDKKGLQRNAKLLNIHQHYEYLPIVFLGRTANSQKKLGAPISKEQKQYFRQKDIANFQAIHQLVQDLPQDLMFVIRATNLISSHNIKLGGTQRERYQTFTQYCLKNIHSTEIGYGFGLMGLSIRLWIFEHLNWFYRLFFGTLAI